jgi:Arc/MetJ family transcription regulator
MIRMRTTLDLPAPLLDEAQRLLGFKSKTDTVVLSLTELIRRHRIDELKSLAGKVDLGIDLARSRRRPGPLRARTAQVARSKVVREHARPLAKS